MSIGLGLGMGFGGGAVVASDPMPTVAALPLSLYLDGADYAAGTWAGRASAGTSGSHTATTEGSDPTVGATLNGHQTVQFAAASTQHLSLAAHASDLFGASAWSFWCLCNPHFPGTATRILNAVTFDFYVFGAWELLLGSANAASAASYDAWQMFQAKYDGTNLKARTNSGAWVSVAAAGVAMTGAAKLGAYSDNSFPFDGKMASVGASATTLSDANFDTIRTALNTRYALSL